MTDATNAPAPGNDADRPATPEEIAALQQQIADFVAQIEADRQRLHDAEIARLTHHLANATDDAERDEIRGWLERTQRDWEESHAPQPGTPQAEPVTD